MVQIQYNICNIPKIHSSGHIGLTRNQLFDITTFFILSNINLKLEKSID